MTPEEQIQAFNFPPGTFMVLREDAIPKGWRKEATEKQTIILAPGLAVCMRVNDESDTTATA